MIPSRTPRMRRPEALGGLVARVLDDLGLDKTALVTRVVGCWEAVVGPEIAQHSQPTALRGNADPPSRRSSAMPRGTSPPDSKSSY